MDANELRAAADRVIYYGWHYPCSQFPDNLQPLVDAQSVCDTFLAEHDPTPLTLDIVRKYAETERDEDDGVLHFEFEMELECMAGPLGGVNEWAWLAGGIGLPECLHPTTVGELATLARLCGFSLKERT